MPYTTKSHYLNHITIAPYTVRRIVECDPSIEVGD